MYTFTAEEERVKEEDVGDDFMEDEFDQYQESVFRDLNAVSDLAVKLNRRQLRVLRVRNKKIFQRDSEKHKCGRGGCINPQGCYSFRKKKQSTGKTLYISWSCPNGRNPQRYLTKGQKNDPANAKNEKVNTAVTEFNNSVNGGKVKIIPEKDRKYITVVPDPGKKGFRMATVFEKIDPRVPSITAKLCGTENTGSGVQHLFATPIENGPKVSAISVSTKNRPFENKSENKSETTIGHSKKKEQNKDSDDGLVVSHRKTGDNIVIQKKSKTPGKVKQIRKSPSKRNTEDEKEKPTTVKKLSISKKKKIREAIQKSNTDLAIKVVNEVENADENVVKRIRESGAEMHDNLLLTDYKEYWINSQFKIKRSWEMRYSGPRLSRRTMITIRKEAERTPPATAAMTATDTTQINDRPKRRMGVSRNRNLPE